MWDEDWQTAFQTLRCYESTQLKVLRYSEDVPKRPGIDLRPIHPAAGHQLEQLATSDAPGQRADESGYCETGATGSPTASAVALRQRSLQPCNTLTG